MTHPTDEELDALVGRMSKLADDMDKHATYDWDEHEDVRATLNAITALRTQLAEVKADKERVGRELNLARYGQPDFSWQVHKEALAAANARADRAEAALAALESAPHVNETQKSDHDSADVLTAAPAPVTLAEALQDVFVERQRQISTEGWTTEHDDTHINGEMAQAAACYALNAAGWKTEALRGCWPMAWASAWFKPAVPRRDLVKAGALIIAEIERLDRAALRAIEEGEA